jgi:hypothetical protein
MKKSIIERIFKLKKENDALAIENAKLKSNFLPTKDSALFIELDSNKE